MTHLEAVALDLATKHALAAGVREPWTWATEHAAEFLEQAADPAVQAAVERETDELLADFDNFCLLAEIFGGPAPPDDATLAEHVAYAERLARLMPPTSGSD